MISSVLRDISEIRLNQSWIRPRSTTNLRLKPFPATTFFYVFTTLAANQLTLCISNYVSRFLHFLPHKDSARIKGEKITSDAITGYLVHALSVSRHLLQRQNLTL